MAYKERYSVADLVAAVDKWIDTIYRVLIKPLPKLHDALNAGRVEGYSKEQLRQELDEELAEHIAEQNAHPLTLSDIYRCSTIHIPDFPSRITLEDGNTRVRVGYFLCTILDRVIPIDSATFALLNRDTQFLILKLTKTTDGYEGSLRLSETPVMGYMEHTLAQISRNPSRLHLLSYPYELQ